MPLSRHLILPHGLYRRGALPPHSAPKWTEVKDTLAALGLTVTRVPGKVTLSASDGDPLYMAGDYPAPRHVIHRLMAVTARLLARALQVEAARNCWVDGDDIARNALLVWVQAETTSNRDIPFKPADKRRIRRAMQVAFLPEDWLVRLRMLAPLFPLRTPLRVELRSLLRVMAFDALDQMLPASNVSPPQRRRL